MTLELWDISFYLCTSKALIKHICLCVNIQFKQLKFIYAHYNNSNNVFYHYNISACNWLHNIVQFNENQEISLSAWLLTLRLQDIYELLFMLKYSVQPTLSDSLYLITKTMYYTRICYNPPTTTQQIVFLSTTILV